MAASDNPTTCGLVEEIFDTAPSASEIKEVRAYAMSFVTQPSSASCGSASNSASWRAIFSSRQVSSLSRKAMNSPLANFEPALRAGDRLRFALRANPVIARAEAPGQRGKRHDVVMDALRAVPRDDRAKARGEAILTAGRAWLARQGERHGFAPEGDAAVDGYETLRIPRAKAAPARIGIADFEGVLRVADPARFLAQLAQGFGRARAFGCGLMLIRRAR